jgi:hypothetical protein
MKTRHIVFRSKLRITFKFYLFILLECLKYSSLRRKEPKLILSDLRQSLSPFFGKIKNKKNSMAVLRRKIVKVVSKREINLCL